MVGPVCVAFFAYGRTFCVFVRLLPARIDTPWLLYRGGGIGRVHGLY